MKTGKIFFSLFVLELIFCILIFLSLTAFRFLDSKNYEKFMREYAELYKFDTNISLVYDGE